MAESKMPARIWAHPPASKKGCIISFTAPSADYNVAYIRADIVEQMVEALGVVAHSGKFQCFDDDAWGVVNQALATYAAAVGSKDTTP